MTLTEIKTAILDQLKTIQLNDRYQAILLATDKASLLDALSGVYEWFYQSGILSNIILDEFTEAELNAKGIYYAGAPTITNPAGNVILLKEVDATVSVDGDNKIKIRIMGTASCTLNLENNAYAEITAYDAAVCDATASDNASLLMVVDQACVVSCISNGNAVVHAVLKNTSSLDYTGNNTSYALIKAFDNTSGHYLLNDTAVLKSRTFNKSTFKQAEI